MICHIVMFRFLENAKGKSKEENLKEAREKMMALANEIPEIVEMDVLFGAPGSAPANYDYILVSKFHSLQDLAAYQRHPAHVAFGEYVKELREPDGRACIDYEI